VNAILAFLGSKRMIALLFGLAGTVLGLFASEGVKWWLNRPIPKIELASPVFDGFEPPHTKIRRPFELRMQTTPFYSDPRVLSFLAGDTITLANLVDMISGLGGQTEFQVNLKLGLTPSALKRTPSALHPERENRYPFQRPAHNSHCLLCFPPPQDRREQFAPDPAEPGSTSTCHPSPAGTAARKSSRRAGRHAAAV